MTEVSKQILQLEDELGIPIFQRKGKHLTEPTAAGASVIEVAGRILGEIENIRRIAMETKGGSRGSLSIATTHTQARYVLPPTIKRFIAKYMYDFIELFAPHLTREVVDRAMSATTREEFERLFDEPELPQY